MLERRLLFGAAIGSVVAPVAALAQATPPASMRLNELGPEGQLIARRVGMWDVTETVWASPGVPPVTTTGLVAECRIMGSLRLG